MRIECPSCSAAYEVPEERLVPGGKVRCVRCGAEWAPIAAEIRPEPPVYDTPPPFAPDTAHEEPSRPPAFTAMDRLARYPATVRGRPTALVAAWAASIGLVILLIVCAFIWREDIMQAWPPSERVYNALGVADHGARSR